MGQRDCHHGSDVGVICQGEVGLGVAKFGTENKMIVHEL